jgi:hypothetical protein
MSTSTTASAGQVDIVDRQGFLPQPYLYCLRCSKQFLLCPCRNLAHGQEMFYVLDAPPAQYSVMQRIRRWAVLISMHPSLHIFDAKRFVRDLPSTFEKDLRIMKPIIQVFMDEYQTKEMSNTATLLGMNSDKGMEECRKSCAYAMEHFFQGNWGYPTKLEYAFLHNAIQMCKPESLDRQTRDRMQRIFECIGLISETYEKAGQKNWEYRLEDLRNPGERYLFEE